MGDTMKKTMAVLLMMLLIVGCSKVDRRIIDPVPEVKTETWSEYILNHKACVAFSLLFVSDIFLGIHRLYKVNNDNESLLKENKELKKDNRLLKNDNEGHKEYEVYLIEQSSHHGKLLGQTQKTLQETATDYVQLNENLLIKERTLAEVIDERETLKTTLDFTKEERDNYKKEAELQTALKTNLSNRYNEVCSNADKLIKEITELKKKLLP
jgi:hypothetical protein